MALTEDLVRVTWQCVHFVEPKTEATLSAELKNSGISAFRIDCAAIDTELGLLTALAGELQFPNYFGMNWDALEECLRDMGWLPRKQYILFVTSAEVFWKAAPQLGGSLIDSWLFAAEEWSRQGVPFHIVFVW